MADPRWLLRSPPPGYDFASDCTNAARNIVAASILSGAIPMRPTGRWTNASWRPAMTNASGVANRRPSLTAFAGPLPAEAMAKTGIEIAASGSRRMLHVALSLRTGAPGGIPAISTTGTRSGCRPEYLARTPWRPMPLTPTPIGGWPGSRRRHRPGEAQPAIWSCRAAASGTYRIGVTLVQDGVAWFHDRGLAIAISARP